MTISIADRLTTGDTQSTFNLSMDVIRGVQNHDAAKQIQSLAVLFVSLCSVHEIDPRDALARADRIIKEAEEKRLTELRALRRYLKEELQ